jgi:hypothetical protein
MAGAMNEDLFVALGPVVDALERLGIPYSIGGSVASSYHGIPRSTADADLVAELPAAKVDALVAALGPTYYVDAEMIRDAIRRESCFNVIHMTIAVKIDVFVLPRRAYDQASFARRQPWRLDGRELAVDTPEDVVLHKLEWYRQGGCVSDRQWTDIVGVLKARRATIDLAYLRQWAAEIGVADLLGRALVDAGIPS